MLDEELIRIVNLQYQEKFDQINLIRDMIGRVCLLEGGGRRYVLKVYPAVCRERAIQAAEIMVYLQKAGFDVPDIIMTKTGDPYFTLRESPDLLEQVCVLYDYIAGTELDEPLPFEELGEQVGLLYRAMRDYPGTLIPYEKPYFIDTYLQYLQAFGIDERQFVWFQAYGAELWDRVKNLPRGFYHGDMHEGNILRAETGALVLFDFDQAGFALPSYDMAVLCNRSEYFRFDAAAYDRIADAVQRFSGAYRKVAPLTAAEIAAVYDFVAMHHYQCQAAIIEKFGLSEFDRDFFTAQYEWLAAWRELCEKKRTAQHFGLQN